jgi:hypothetical protein
MKFPKPTRKRDPKAIERVRKQACQACAARPAHAHHVTTRGAGGGDTKNNLMPLCFEHHAEWHNTGPSFMIARYPRVKEWLIDHDRFDLLWDYCSGLNS